MNDEQKWAIIHAVCESIGDSDIRHVKVEGNLCDIFLEPEGKIDPKDVQTAEISVISITFPK